MVGNMRSVTMARVLAVAGAVALYAGATMYSLALPFGVTGCFDYCGSVSNIIGTAVVFAVVLLGPGLALTATAWLLTLGTLRGAERRRANWVASLALLFSLGVALALAIYFARDPGPYWTADSVAVGGLPQLEGLRYAAFALLIWSVALVVVALRARPAQ